MSDASGAPGVGEELPYLLGGELLACSSAFSSGKSKESRRRAGSMTLWESLGVSLWKDDRRASPAFSSLCPKEDILMASAFAACEACWGRDLWSIPPVNLRRSSPSNMLLRVEGGAALETLGYPAAAFSCAVVAGNVGYIPELD